MALYSPPWLAESARQVMGHIDLDPCSCGVANEIVQAKKIYTRRDNGLAKPWFGNLYLNPPFIESNLWIRKLRNEHQVKQVILVSSFVVSHHEWFTWVWRNFIICLPDSRIRYWHPLRSSSSPRSFVGYSGPHQDRFVSVFGPRGLLLRRVN